MYAGLYHFNNEMRELCYPKCPFMYLLMLAMFPTPKKARYKKNI